MRDFIEVVLFFPSLFAKPLTHMNSDQLENNILNVIVPEEGDAYEGVFRAYYEQLVVYAFYLVEDEMEAEDIVQNLFIYIWQKDVLKDIKTNIKGYLMRAIRNRCLNFIEKNNRTNTAMQEYYQEELVDAHLNVLQKNALSSKDIHQYLQVLPPKRQEALRLVYLQDKAYKDAAAEMGITINSIKTHLKLGVKALKSQFKK